MSTTDNCIFCKIVAGEIPSKKVYEDDDFLAFHDIAPKADTHLLVIPKRHIVNLNDLNEDDAELMGKMMLVIPKIAEQEGLGDKFRLVVNNGEGAGQSVFHLHLHIIGGRALKWPPG